LPLFPCQVLKKEEEEKKARVGTGRKITIGKVDGPDLTSFVRQFPPDSKGITFSLPID
jgi:NADH dehydrogenase [ubiquinone] 1 alpha subcomplex assembly factor 2